MAVSPGSSPPTLRARSARAVTYNHPVNRAYHDEAPVGARIADAVTGFMGSWKFIAIQTVIVVIWIVGNVILLFNFDPFPFILLNLAFSTQAAYAAPLILLAGNRQALRDRMTLEHTASEADKEDRQNQRLLEGNKALEVSNQEILKRVEALEQRILQLEKSIIERLDRRLGESRPG
ncbi:MAG TPA: DUF1003 domain-containing protein [Candidatus Limnocylindrales bacterium]|jgi:uncharacterized membrane protein|nr:DUF1003 domain-containing protein [Candidatus Limnocylindrales bacterium]